MKNILFKAKQRAIVCLVGGCMAFGAMNSAQGAIVYSGLENLTISHRSGEGVNFHFVGSDEHFTIQNGRGGIGVWEEDFSKEGFILERYSIVLDDDTDQNIATEFEFGTVIGSDFQWDPGFTAATLISYGTHDFGTGNFFDRSDGYLPIRTAFDDNEYFGWLRISHSMDNELLTIHDWAWNSISGEPILAGEIPEPKVYALLLGIGVLLWAAECRRRRSVVYGK